MKCLNCGKLLSQIEGKKARVFCNDACRMAYKRKFKSEQIKSEQSKSEQSKSEQIKSEQIKSEQPNPNKYTVVEGKKVYGRRAVIYEHEKNGITNSLGAVWKMRPEPENPDDIPDEDNRCIYTRRDGSRYLIDALGKQAEISVADKHTGKLSKEELYTRIDHYPADTWKDSLEFKELKRRLNSMSLKDLKEQEYWIPSWKLADN